MKCPNCGGPTVWRGSLSRGKMACDGCEPYADDKKSWHPDAGLCSPTLRRYYDEVYSWHRNWCAARKAVAAGKSKSTDPNLCTCGHTQKTPYSDAQIEQFEIANYGLATMRAPLLLLPAQPGMLERLAAVKARNDYRRTYPRATEPPAQLFGRAWRRASSLVLDYVDPKRTEPVCTPVDWGIEPPTKNDGYSIAELIAAGHLLPLRDEGRCDD